MIIANPVSGVIHPSGWARPVGNLDFAVTQWFGCTGFYLEPPYGTCAHFHRGLDLGNKHCGANVLAVAPGKVTAVGPDPYSNNALRVQITHAGGWRSLYYHLHDFTVKLGQLVTTGQVIGHVGMTGKATACHLHFQINADATANSMLDPWPHLSQNVTVRPKGPGINIRSSAGSGSTLGPVYAHTRDDGNIYTLAGVNIGATSIWRKWGGIVTGATYSVNGVSNNKWVRIWLGGAWRYIAVPLAQQSTY